MNVELAYGEDLILLEIADENFTRDNIALHYACCISSVDEIDFEKINKAIVARWSMSTLEYLKKNAWAIVKKWEQENK